ncbi:type IVB secretion system protein IcmV [Legionella nagasakiensis]|uniref:type IVB secretion system protein IcmV n=1 Tax=Legionella nagasakiensis TaxID=535290 RepID=UPI0010555CE5|nr:type IVB secretion system protein IcmV [Legionella nagasakiensis]
MKKKSGSRIGKIVRSIFNVRGWADWDRVKGWTSYILLGIKRLFVPQHRDSRVPFEVIQAQFNLTNSQLLAKQKALFRLCLLMILFAVLLLSYSIYLLVLGHILAFALSLIVTLIALVLAFRYHFWYFQIRERKLGCSLREWLRQGIMGDKP